MEAGVRRPLIVTDSGVAKLSWLNSLHNLIQSSGLEPGIYSNVSGNPVKSQVDRGVSAYRTHRADAIIGIGGGAALDVAKAIALMINHSGDLFDYEDEKSGARLFDQSIPYWIAVPTTSGTGSEVGRSAVISDEQTHLKKIIFSPKLLAKAVFADPELTLELPAKITAATGMDAFTHCVEAYLAKGYHPICDGIALEGIRLSATNLKKCVQTPQDLDARSQMMMASMMGAIAFQKGLGLNHSCAHALSTFKDLHHGMANGIMIDHALKFNISTVPDRFSRIAATIGLEKNTGEEFLVWLKQWKMELGIPARLSEVGITSSNRDKLAELAFLDSCHSNNPRPCTQNDFKLIFEEAI